MGTHTNPDGDAIGTQLAFAAYLRDLGKDVVMLRDSDIPEKYLFLEDVKHILPVDEYQKAEPFDTVLILECPNLDRLGAVSRFVTAGANIVNIDHHRDSEPLGHINWFDNTVSSVGEMAYVFFKEVQYKISPIVAEQLYTAILTDTGRFRYDSTSPRTMALAGELIDLGANPQKVCNEVYFDIRPSTMKLIGKVLNGIEFYLCNRICLMTLTRKMLEESGADESAVEGLVDHTMYSRGVVAGALLKEMDNGETRVSLRSYNGIDVASVAGVFGGGGHTNASGCTLQKKIDDARSDILSVLTEAVEREAN